MLRWQYAISVCVMNGVVDDVYTSLRSTGQGTGSSDFPAISRDTRKRDTILYVLTTAAVSTNKSCTFSSRFSSAARDCWNSFNRRENIESGTFISFVDASANARAAACKDVSGSDDDVGERFEMSRMILS